MRIESTVARRALMRQGIVVVVLLVFAGWFGWDGWVGYPTKNMDQAKGNFPVVPAGAVPQYAEVTVESAKEFQDRLKADSGSRLTLDDLRKAWKEPAYLGAAEASGSGAAAGGQAAFFVGTYGWAKASLVGDVISGIEWHDGEKSYSAVAVQKLLAAVLGVVAMIPLGILLGLMSGKYVLDDEGLGLPGNKQIRYAQMTGIDLADLQKRGIVRLTYQNEKGEEATAVLDEERVEKFEDIVLNLCEKKGWQEQLEQAAAEAEPPSDATKE